VVEISFLVILKIYTDYGISQIDRRLTLIMGFRIFHLR